MLGIAFLTDFRTRLRSDRSVQGKYVEAGREFGDAVSYLYLGECVGFENLLDDLERWEEVYADRGFRTVSIDAFRRHGGYGEDITGLLGQRRDKDEDPILHAQIYREHFLGKVAPVVDWSAMMEDEGPRMVQFIDPSTEE